MSSEHSNNWPAKFRQFIVHGEVPRAKGPSDYPTPEGHLAQLYAKAKEPAATAFRHALQNCIGEQLFRREAGHEALARAMRLVACVPHGDFADVLRRVFFEETESDVGRLALLAMHPLQSKLTKEQRDMSRAVWLALLTDSRHGISAYHGLRSLDPELAIRNLPLLLGRVDLQSHGLKIMLDGFAEELKDRLDERKILQALTETLVGLSLQRRELFRAAFLRGFGEDLLTEATQAALKRARSDLEERSAAVVKKSKSPIGDLLRKLFGEGVEWLMDRLPVEAMSVWLIDDEKNHAAFVTQRGCPRDPPKLFFKLGSSQDVAEGLAGKAWRAGKPLRGDVSGTSCVVYDRSVLAEHGFREAYGIPSWKGDDALPSLQIVVDLFSKSVGTLQRLVEDGSCVQHVDLVREVCQALVRRHSEQQVAHLSDELDRAPALTEVFKAFNGQIKKAIGCDVTGFGLDHPRFEELVSAPTEAGKSEISFAPYALNNTLLKGVLGRSTMRRSVDPRDLKKENQFDRSGRDSTDDAADEAILGLVPQTGSSCESVDFMARALRRPAPLGFTGSLVGIVHLARRADAARDIGYTPISAYLFEELCRVVTSSIARAFNSFLRQTRQTRLLMPAATGGNGEMEFRLDRCRYRMQSRIKRLIQEWCPSTAPQYKRTFVSARIFIRGSGFAHAIGNCQPVWIDGKASKEEKDSRRELQRCIRDSIEKAFDSKSSAAVVDEAFLNKIRVDERFVDNLCALNLVLVPVMQNEVTRGLIGLEYERPGDAADAVGWINKQASGRFVQRSVSEHWDYYRNSVKLIISDGLEKWSEDCTEIGGRAQFLEYLRFGFRLDPNSRSSQPPEYRDFVRAALGDPDYDDHCSLHQAWNERSQFLGVKPREFERPDLRCWAKNPNVRAVFLTATALSENGSKLELPSRTFGKRTSIRIRTQPNGQPKLEKRGLRLAQEVARHQGWGVMSKGSDLTIEVPLYPIGEKIK